MTIIQNKEKERGSVTVEASIALVTFTFVLVSLLMFINVARAQMMIQDALNKSCLEISEYMYLYKVSGLYSLDMGLQEAGSGAQEKIDGLVAGADKTVAGVESILSNVSQTGKNIAQGNVSTEDLQQTYEAIIKDKDTITEQVDGLKGVFKDITQDPIGFGKQMIALGASTGLNAGKSFLFGNILASNISAKYLGANSEGIANKEYADTKLKNLGVVDGLEGLEFKYSSIFAKDSPADVNLVVVYKVRVFPWISDMTVQFSQSASTRAWIGGDAVDRMK